VAEVNRVVYTLGTSTRTLEEFIALLQHLEVEVVVDVRRFPTSRFEYFRKEELARSLLEAGIDYGYLGGELGGYRRGGYQAFLATEEFQQGLGKLEAIAKERKTAIVCAERLPWRCHRRFIGGELERRGWQVIHVIDERRTWSPKANF
jgi:uncharacterized protein (DUF488 family)